MDFQKDENASIDLKRHGDDFRVGLSRTTMSDSKTLRTSSSDGSACSDGLRSTSSDSTRSDSSHDYHKSMAERAMDFYRRTKSSKKKDKTPKGVMILKIDKDSDCSEWWNL
mmetsp:Transcript_67593/g.140903  ORF Transcript_67593/g.140903 Transcript_67593/m.140903 type:complete len:111 (+) Transcript_67593:55-387(+)|eukprot:CAMPEP_0181309728 /NCGR_PEP_ID=MMETSP1101-20121128/12173_1 /TAXON_ID=46948 /ORGANISM="Rhodomonas abbreviata, Strain Caron Lab Isolate" /LENGTH=110 /DNA_ID=CAMNT_0023416241 /DNA_START=50 /DNA_END=382 /DNA_ORIENTATION=+